MNTPDFRYPIEFQDFDFEEVKNIFRTYLPDTALLEALKYDSSNAYRVYYPIMRLLQGFLNITNVYVKELDPKYANIFLEAYEKTLGLPNKYINFGTTNEVRVQAILFVLENSLSMLTPKDYLALVNSVGLSYIRGYYASSIDTKLGWQYTTKNLIKNSSIRYWSYDRSDIPNFNSTPINICDGWIGVNAGNFSQVSDVSFDSSLCVKRLIGTTTQNIISCATILDSDAVALAKGQRVMISSYVKLGNGLKGEYVTMTVRATNGSGNTVHINTSLPYLLYNSLSSLISGEIDSINSENDRDIWQRINIAVDIPSDTESIVIEFTNNANGNIAPSIQDDCFYVTNVQCDVSFDLNDYFETQYVFANIPYETTRDSEYDITMISHSDYASGYIIEVDRNDETNKRAIIELFRSLRLRGVKIIILAV